MMMKCECDCLPLLVDPRVDVGDDHLGLLVESFAVVARLLQARLELLVLLAQLHALERERLQLGVHAARLVHLEAALVARVLQLAAQHAHQLVLALGLVARLARLLVAAPQLVAQRRHLFVGALGRVLALEHLLLGLHVLAVDELVLLLQVRHLVAERLFGVAQIRQVVLEVGVLLGLVGQHAQRLAVVAIARRYQQLQFVDLHTKYNNKYMFNPKLVFRYKVSTLLVFDSRGARCSNRDTAAGSSPHTPSAASQSPRIWPAFKH